MINDFTKQVKDAAVLYGKAVYDVATGGQASNAYNASFGKDYYTGQQLSTTDRVISGISFVSFYLSALGPEVKAAQSVWALNQMQRGVVIERALGGWNNNFPVIDKAGSIVNGFRTSITSIKSMNLGPEYYQGKNAVYNAVMGYVKKLADFKSTVSNDIRVTINSSTERILELAIPTNATSAQLTQLNNAITAAGKQGVQIVLKIFQ